MMGAWWHGCSWLRVSGWQKNARGARAISRTRKTEFIFRYFGVFGAKDQIRQPRDYANFSRKFKGVF
jgi:hypothetical protein